MASARRLTKVIWKVSASASRTIASSVSTRSRKSFADIWASVRAGCAGAQRSVLWRDAESAEVLRRHLVFRPGGLLGREKTIVVDRRGGVVGQADQHALVDVTERPWCATADIEESLDLLSDDDGGGEGAADAFGVDRFGVLRWHRWPRDTFGRTPRSAADHGMPTDTQARPDA